MYACPAAALSTTCGRCAPVRDFFVGPYGLLHTVGLTYGLAIVLPIVLTFFLVFALLEDSGYLPRLAVMSDRFMRLMGLNGRAVLPMVLSRSATPCPTCLDRHRAGCILNHRCANPYRSGLPAVRPGSPLLLRHRSA